ncbi:FG-GAP repeat protein [Novosphingobium aquiterrae]|uniref:FG-GAP repeat protein n=1 Tax=Novosphingobium aquiterrae TaxID=624388 RepID=A0ABV6PJQ2_9SPHN
MRYLTAILCSGFALAAASAANAASSDYLLEIDSIKGEAAVESWSFGACNAGQCSTVTSPRDRASGMATGKAAYDKCCRPQASQNTQSLRESPTRASTGATAVTEAPSATAAAGTPRASWDLATSKGGRMAGGVNVAAGDVDGDGHADLAYAATVSEVSNLTLTFQKIEAEWRSVCPGKHIAHATLRTAAGDFEITDATVECSAPAAAGARIDQTPARMSTNMTVPKQTQGATFGEKVQSGLSSPGSAVASGAMTITFTGGQMKHTKTGHVTLLK